MVQNPAGWEIQFCVPCTEGSLAETGGNENIFGLYHWLILPVITVFGSYGIGSVNARIAAGRWLPWH